jgi:peptide/nickel transport system substrate-binding protein
MKRIIAGMLVVLLLLGVLAGCGKKEESKENGDLVKPKEPPKVVILTNAGYGDEAWANVIKDQLQKAGFAPEISLQPDYASWRAQVDAKNFDLAITYWNTVTGSPDYAVRSVWHSEGPLNLYGIDDEHLDELIEKGSEQTSDEYMETYSEFEDYLVEDKAYVIPIYVSIKTLAANKDIMNPDTVRISKSRSMCWEELRFKDASKQETDPFIMSQTASNLTPLDPIRADDGSTFMLNTNCYIRLMNLTDTDEITTDSTLSRAYAIGGSGSDFYFLLRDDVFFSKVENGHAVNTGERVGAEDAVYSMDRMKDEKCVPDHKNFNNFTAMDKNEIVTDIDTLKKHAVQDGRKERLRHSLGKRSDGDCNPDGRQSQGGQRCGFLSGRAYDHEVSFPADPQRTRAFFGRHREQEQDRRTERGLSEQSGRVQCRNRRPLRRAVLVYGRGKLQQYPGLQRSLHPDQEERL